MVISIRIKLYFPKFYVVKFRILSIIIIIIFLNFYHEELCPVVVAILPIIPGKKPALIDDMSL